MVGYLIIHELSGHRRWLHCGRDGQVIDEGRGTLPAVDDARVTVLVDMADCLALTVPLPELSGRRLRQALPYALEEHLAGRVEAQHVVDAGRDAAGKVRALVIERARLQTYLETLGEAGIDAGALLPDALCLPWRDGELVLYPTPDRILARWGDWQAASLEPGMFAALLPEIACERVRCYGDPPACLDAVTVPVERLPGGLAVFVERARALTGQLLTDPYAPASSRRHHRRWLWAAGLAGGVVAAQFLFAGIEYLQLRGQAEALRVEIGEHFRQAFPEVDPVAGRERLLAERELARLRFGEAEGFIELLAAAAPVVEGSGDAEVQSLDYRDGALEMRLRVASIAELDQLERRLSASGIGARVQSASTGADGADGRLVIQR